MSEREIKRALMLDLSNGDTRLFNNPVGVAVFPDGSRVVYGLHPGSSDLIGYNTITITPDMVGRRVAVFTAIETKSRRGQTRANQANFIRAVREAGGIAGVARDVEDGRQLIHEFVKGASPCQK